MNHTDTQCLTDALADAIRTFRHTTGGVDPVACTAACREIVRLRGLLRDDPAMMKHLGHVITHRQA